MFLRPILLVFKYPKWDTYYGSSRNRFFAPQTSSQYIRSTQKRHLLLELWKLMPKARDAWGRSNFQTRFGPLLYFSILQVDMEWFNSSIIARSALYKALIASIWFTKGIELWNVCDACVVSDFLNWLLFGFAICRWFGALISRSNVIVDHLVFRNYSSDITKIHSLSA